MVERGHEKKIDLFLILLMIFMFKMGRWALNNHTSKHMEANKHKVRKTKQKASKK